jgi:hypothetical protein
VASTLPMPEKTSQAEIDSFILKHIDSVPHLEALLLLWNTRPKPWPVEELGRRIFLSDEITRRILQDLARQGLVAAEANSTEQFRFLETSTEQTRLLAVLADTYRHELVRVSNLIHTKPSAAVLEFARAFRFKKD